jgi:hypothetical protein
MVLVSLSQFVFSDSLVPCRVPGVAFITKYLGTSSTAHKRKWENIFLSHYRVQVTYQVWYKFGFNCPIYPDKRLGPVQSIYTSVLRYIRPAQTLGICASMLFYNIASLTVDKSNCLSWRILANKSELPYNQKAPRLRPNSE